MCPLNGICTPPPPSPPSPSPGPSPPGPSPPGPSPPGEEGSAFKVCFFRRCIIVVSHEDAAQLPQLKESISTAIHIRPHTIGAMLFRACLRARGGVRAAYERLLDHFFRTDKDGPEDPQDLPDLLTPSSLAQPEERRLRVVARSSAPPTLLPGKVAADASEEKFAAPSPPTQRWVPTGAPSACALPFEFEGLPQDDCVAIGDVAWCPNADGVWGIC